MPESFQAYVGLEAEASLIREYAAEFVPGLLQTEDYYREFLSTAPADAGTGRKIEVRMTRQQRLTGDDRSYYWAVLNEAVIRRTVGGPQVMRTPLARILELGALRGVMVQVLPFTAGAHPRWKGHSASSASPSPSTRTSFTWKTRPVACTSRMRMNRPLLTGHYPPDGQGCSGNGNNCVEIAANDWHVAVRDTTDRAGATAIFSGQAWRRSRPASSAASSSW
jgi:hypothetical protein